MAEHQQPEEFPSFYFKKIVDGKEIDYRITENEGHFGIEQDGTIIAEFQQNEVWEQTSGEPLDSELSSQIVSEIKKYYH